jgi:NAD(P)-dependent dehydrogenase (short-subunit alcohol dehydrogenase family)
MGWGTADIPHQHGKIAVVTGANGGLGLETAKALAGAGAHVVVAARDQVKTSAAIDVIRAAHPAASLETVALDLASRASVHEAAAAIAANHEGVDVLVNNAGLMAVPERATADGFEMQLGVNHLGHFALTARLLPQLLRAHGRVVSVTSTVHHFGRRVDPANPHLHGRYGPWPAGRHDRDESSAWRPPTAAGGGGSLRPQWRALRTAVHQLRGAGAPADSAQDRAAAVDRGALGGVRTRDR